jgi:hypothetical protein
MSVADPKRTFDVSNNSMDTLMEKEMRKLAETRQISGFETALTGYCSLSGFFGIFRRHKLAHVNSIPNAGHNVSLLPTGNRRELAITKRREKTYT